MARRSYSEVIGGIQGALGPLLASRGFEVSGFTYNRVTDDDLTQVVNLQVYPHILPYAGWQDYEARFTINLGVYVPEVARCFAGRRKLPWIEEHMCTVRQRLGRASGYNGDLWWPLLFGEADITDIRRRLKTGGLRFLDRYATRDNILEKCNEPEERRWCIHLAEVVTAIILSERGEKDRARVILADYVQGITMKEHEDFIRKLAKKLGIWRLER